MVPKWFNPRIYQVTAWTNMISGVIGFILSLLLNGGWYSVVWFPWVSEHEINLKRPGALQFLIFYYAGAFVVTLIIESLTNIFFLRDEFPVKRILRATVVANILSYIAGTIVLYSYSFN